MSFIQFWGSFSTTFLFTSCLCGTDFNVAVPFIPSGWRCWHWYPGRLSVCLAGIGGGGGWGVIVRVEKERERERDRKGKHLCRSPCLLSCAQCSGPTAPTFPPHFLHTAGSLSFSLSDAVSPSLTPPSRRKPVAGLEWLTTCFAWSESSGEGGFLGRGGILRVGKEESREGRREPLHPPRGGILFYSKQAQCHPSFPLFTRLTPFVSANAWQEYC